MTSDQFDDVPGDDCEFMRDKEDDINRLADRLNDLIYDIVQDECIDIGVLVGATSLVAADWIIKARGISDGKEALLSKLCVPQLMARESIVVSSRVLDREIAATDPEMN